MDRRAQLREFASRDWALAARSTAEYWRAWKRRHGAAGGVRIADELRLQVLAQRPGWPSPAERREDRAVHLRVGEGAPPCPGVPPPLNVDVTVRFGAKAPEALAANLRRAGFSLRLPRFESLVNHRRVPSKRPRTDSVRAGSNTSKSIMKTATP